MLNTSKPKVDFLGTDDLETLFHQHLEQASGAQLTADDGSVPWMLMKALNAALVRLEQNFNEALDQYIALSWSQYQVPRGEGTAAAATARFELSGNRDRDTVIQKYYRFQVGDAIFETQERLTIPIGLNTLDPVNHDRCSVQAIAIEPGAVGNSPPIAATITNPIANLSRIMLDEGAAGGSDYEDPRAYIDRVAALQAAKISDRVVTVDEHQAFAVGMMGDGSTALTVPNVRPDGETEIAAVTTYVMGPGGLEVGDDLRERIKAETEARSPLVMSGLHIEKMPVDHIDVQLVIVPKPTTNPAEFSIKMNRAIRDHFSLENTAKMPILDIYALSGIVYGSGEVEQADFLWGERGALQSNRFTPGLLVPTPPSKRLVLGANQDPVSGPTRPVKIDKISFQFTTGYSVEFEA